MGLVRSHVLVSSGGAVRLVLDASESHGTGTGRFVLFTAGAGIHHVALFTANLRRSAVALDARGALLLPMTDTYYDDFATRWNLNDAAIKMLQEHGLMYDSDGADEFWHLYTDAFQERFFFEVVQRRGGYAGFGAANAPVRAAAQARQHRADAGFL